MQYSSYLLLKSLGSLLLGIEKVQNAKLYNFFSGTSTSGNSYGGTSATSYMSFQLSRTFSCLKNVLNMHTKRPFKVYYTKCIVLFLRFFSGRCYILRSTQRKKGRSLPFYLASNVTLV